MVVLNTTTVRTVDRERPRSRMMLAVIDRMATTWWQRKDLAVGSSTKINRGCQFINGMWEMVAGNSNCSIDRNKTAKDQIP